MAPITLFLAVVYLSITSHAAIEFNNLIQSNIAHQNELAGDIQKSVQVASNVDESHVPTSTSDIVTPANNMNASPASDSTAGNSNQVKTDVASVKEKDFSLTLKNTGRASALRYFPPKPPRAKRKAKSVANLNLSAKTKSIASVGKIKKVKILKNKKSKSTNTKLVKNNKNKKSVGLVRTQASVEKTK